MKLKTLQERYFSWARHIPPFLKLVMHHFIADGGVQHVAGLTYTTLLSLVPLMTVALALFSVFPASDRMSEQIENFLFQNFVPAASEVVQQYLRDFSQKAGKLTGVGFGMLIVVALLLMNNINKAFNTIWHVRKRRSPLAQFTVYWAILSLGPILIAISVAGTSYLVSIPFLDQTMAVAQVRSKLLSLMPVILSTVAFSLLYALVPNRTVPWRNALAGGLLAATLFEVSKRGFALYVTTFPTYEAIYGAVAVVPIFLIWIYLSWMVTLLGAEFTYCLSIYRENWQERLNQRGSDFLLALRLLGELRASQHDGRALGTRALVERLPGVTEERVEHVMNQLGEALLVLRTEERRWVLARDLRQVTLNDLYQSAHYVLPGDDSLDDVPESLREMLQGLNDDLSKAMDKPLESLL